MDSANPIVDVGSAAEAVSAADDDSAPPPLHQIESLCMRCGENGITRLLLTRIPHFREIVLMAFECPHCNERNNEVQFAGELQPRGCCCTLKVPVGDQEMLNRQVVKSESASIKIPELDFEIPPEAQRGTLSTVEGILVRAADELQALQDERKKVDPHTAEALDHFLLKLKSCAVGDAPFTFILDDPAGNSFIENLFAPALDPSLIIKFYERTPEQTASLGFLVDSSSREPASQSGTQEVPEERELVPAGGNGAPHGSVGATACHRAIAQGNTEEFANTLFRYSAPEEVMTFPSTCGACAARYVIVMASSCDACGYRNSELKAGGEVPVKGKRIIVHVQSKEDLNRDSDHASVKIPEIDLELTSGTLGGLVTTVEGLITKISENLDRVHGFEFGDSIEGWKKSKWQDFKSRLNKLLSVEEPWTLVLDDGLARSFVSPITDAIEDDRQLIFEEYKRSWEQDEELGLNDIDTSSADAYYDSKTAS
ncbi:hypothetical protein Syun_005955 [Stephania yunnanensis]|uniref:Zinc finger ZPR1-type domain-containing protein n=1 Tax=Stephania yunnanensis TaxID=152371 RepID=A0AAP0KZ39_9MAGN